MVLDSLETAINQYIRLGKVDISELSGKTILIQLCGTPVQLVFSFSEHSVMVSNVFRGKPDATISAPPFTLLAILKNPDGLKQASDLRVEGDLFVLQAMQKLFKKSGVDWEYQLSLLCGDATAHAIGGMLDRFKKTSKTFGKNVFNQLRDYAVEERRWLVSNEEARVFFEDVDELRHAVARVEKRIDRLLNNVRTLS